MHLASIAALSATALGPLVVPAASSGTAMKPTLPLFAPNGMHVVAWPQPGLRRRTVIAAGCTSSYDASNSSYYDFVGILYSKDVAGAAWSGALGGYGNEACSTYDAVAGGYLNVIGGAGDKGAAAQSFIGGGQNNVIAGQGAFIGAGFLNGVSGTYGFVGAGAGNTATGPDAFVGGGGDNLSSGDGAFVGGGALNVASGVWSFVGAGLSNNAVGNGSFIGGGNYQSHTCIACVGSTVTGVDSFIGDGDANSVSSNLAFVGGGSHNAIAGSAEWGTIAGGHDNTVSGALATIPGGANNTAAGVLSLAAGYHADATRTGSFVWSDYVSGSTVVKDSAPDQFVVRASGGTYVYSSENLKAGVKLAAGSGTWASLSDRDAKADVAPLDDAAILAKVATLPVSTWRYKTEAGVRHVGPMAQDFYAAFRVGEDDRHITSIDEDGVALAAIKALHAENARLHADNADLHSGDVSLHADNAKLHAENANLIRRLSALEKMVEALAAREKRIR